MLRIGTVLWNKKFPTENKTKRKIGVICNKEMTLAQTGSSRVADFKTEEEVIYYLVLLVILPLQLERRFFEVWMQILYLLGFSPL